MSEPLLIPVANTADDERVGDVVFVHGLGGDPREHWMADKDRPETFWPAWIGQDVRNVGVWSLGYDAAKFAWKGTAMPLEDRATSGLARMETVEIGTRPIVFIAHSMGGLLVKQMIRNGIDMGVPRWKAIVDQTKGVCFIATPHTGADLANYIKFLASFLVTVAIEDLKANDPHLRNLNQWYRNHAFTRFKTEVYCEKKVTGWKGLGVIVVDDRSADPGLPGVVPIPLDEDHLSICKPASHESLLYKRVRRFIRDCLPRPTTNVGGNQEGMSRNAAPTVAIITASSPMRVICPLHGIRTLAVWQKGLSDLAAIYGWVCRLDRWSYGRFSLLAFVTPWSREAKLGWLRRQYDAETHDRRLFIEKGQAPSVVAHSFGTYILGYTLLRFDFIRFNKVILCGSILPRDFPWDQLIARGQVQAVRNEFGVRDPWVRWVRWFVRGTGPSGASGFVYTHERLDQEEFDFNHGDYFGIDHMEDRWIPFLNRPLPEIPRAEAGPRCPRPKTAPPWGLYAVLVMVLAAGFLGLKSIGIFDPPAPWHYLCPNCPGESPLKPGLEGLAAARGQGRDAAIRALAALYGLAAKDGHTATIADRDCLAKLRAETLEDLRRDFVAISEGLTNRSEDTATECARLEALAAQVDSVLQLDSQASPPTWLETLKELRRWHCGPSKS